MYALLDCDNFFVSCEKLFCPSLKGKPVVVLSNNDGCVISRSLEAKNLGIPMGAPYFKIKDHLRNNNGIARSSDFALYADISQRIMETIRLNYPELEIYSIDEAFIKLSNHNPIEEGIRLHSLILQNIGIPMSIGIATTKTLCKAAASVAKKKNENKICGLFSNEEINQLLEKTDIEDIWGIGRHLKPSLNFLGIFTARELKEAPLGMIKQKFGLNLEKIVLELNGHAVLDKTSTENKTLTCSGSFEHEIFSKEKLSSILAEYTDRVCLRLRCRQEVAAEISVFIESGRYNNPVPFYHRSAKRHLPHFSNSTISFTQAAQDAFLEIFQAKQGYKRAGVTLSCIENKNQLQGNLFTSFKTNQREEKLMEACDYLNNTWGAGTIILGAKGFSSEKISAQNNLSGINLSSWAALPQTG